MDISQILRKKNPLIMGILNFTPDSFSDGGQFNTLEKALKRAKEMEKEGADIIDIGGESTGPKSKNISLEEELNRVIPVLKKLRKKTNLPISIDTYKAEVARQALEEGANMINDVTALRSDKNMGKTLAKYKCPVILMFSKDASPRTTVKDKKYKNVIKTIEEFFQKRIKYAKQQGILTKNIILDPGMGQFISNIPKYSFEIIARLKELTALKYPITIGISRKSFLTGPATQNHFKDILAKPLTAIAILNGASIIRTHDVTGVKEVINSINN